MQLAKTEPFPDSSAHTGPTASLPACFATLLRQSQTSVGCSVINGNIVCSMHSKTESTLLLSGLTDYISSLCDRACVRVCVRQT